MIRLLIDSFNLIKKHFSSVPRLPFREEKQQVFAVYDNGFRGYRSKSTQELIADNQAILDRIWLISDFSFEEQQNTVFPFITRFVKLAGALPASENSHDLESGGLVKHSLMVCVNALHLLDRNRYSKDECKAFDAAIVYAALAHDLAKIYTDCEIKGEDGYSYKPFNEDFESFQKKHTRNIFYIKFKPKRSTLHKQCHTRNSTLLLKTDHSITTMMKNAVNVENVLNGSDPVWELIKEADTRTLSAIQSLGCYSVDVFSYIRSWLLSLLTTGQYSCNKPDSEMFFIPQGLLIRRDSSIYDELHETHFALTHGFYPGQSYDETDRFSISLRASGLVALCGSHAAFSWHRLLIAEKLIYVEGLVLLIPKPENIPCCDWYPRGRDPFELRDILKKLEDMADRPVVSLTLKQPFDFIRILDTDDILTDETIYGKTIRERNAIAIKNSRLKTRQKQKDNNEALLLAAKEAKQQEQIKDEESNSRTVDSRSPDESPFSEDTNVTAAEDSQTINFTDIQNTQEVFLSAVPKRGRGRPKGSRNKKTAAKQKTATDSI